MNILCLLCFKDISLLTFELLYRSRQTLLLESKVGVRVFISSHTTRCNTAL